MAALEALYARGVKPRHGEVIMILGRPGSLKSGLAMYWVSQMNLPTLYLSPDQSAFTASARLASIITGDTVGMVEVGMRDPSMRDEYMKVLSELNIQFSFSSPITWKGVDEELDAFIELWDSYPQVIVIDNLKDFAGAETDYAEQMAAMQGITEMARATGATVLVLHHASDKTFEAKNNPWAPPSRDQAKNGLGEQPELVLGVALDRDNLDFRIAVLKQRMGADDPSGQTYATLRAEPELTRFHVK